MSQTPQLPMHVELILATGSRAGITAPIMNGYYMIGRHAECQIRPKTRSVSRRHCVVCRDDHAFKVLDLESTSGTKINHQLIEPRVWCELKDGDKLSCGKIRFQVSMKAKQPTAPRPSEDQPATATPVRSAAHPIDHPGFSGAPSSDIDSEPEMVAAGTEMVAGEAWQTFNVADFLESQDDADRERRYDRIRQSHASAVMENPGYDSDEFDSNPFDSGDVEADEMSVAMRAGESETTSSPASQTTEPAVTTDTMAASDRSQTRRQQRHGKHAKKVPVTRRSSPKSGFAKRMASSFSGDTDRFKLVAALVVTLAISGLIASQMFEFTSGPPVRVIEDLD